MYTNIYTFCTLLVHILVHLSWIFGCTMQPQCSYECVLFKTKNLF